MNTFTSWGNLYQYELQGVSFPANFTEIPNITASSLNKTNAYSYCGIFGNYGTSTSNTGLFKLVRPIATTSPICIRWLAIGRWK